MPSLPRATELSPTSVSLQRRSIMLAVVCVIVALAGCGSDSPTGVADRRIGGLKPRAEHYGCVQSGPNAPPDTIEIPSGGECPNGFDTIIWN